MSGLLKLLTSQHYVVHGDSMKPGFEAGQYLLVSRRAYRGASPARGDVVIVRDPTPGKDEVSYLKRIVGLPGEEVTVKEGVVFINGQHLPEPYLRGAPAAFGLSEQTWVLGPSQYFVMGDNRVKSTDSREFGPVPRQRIVGKVWFRYWPPRAWGRIA